MVSSNLENKIAVLVDGPNFGLNKLGTVNTAVLNFGNLAVKEVYINSCEGNNPDTAVKLSQAAGYRPYLGQGKDVDGDILVRGSELVMSARYEFIDALVIVGGDRDYLPLINKAKEYGRIIIGVANGGSYSQDLETSTNHFIKVSPKSYVIDGKTYSLEGTKKASEKPVRQTIQRKRAA